MDPEVKAKWIEALESGKYKQGRGELRNKADGFCCLGVLCDITPGIQWLSAGHLECYWAKYLDGESDDTALPADLSAALDISEPAELTLIEMNDTGAPFPEIAAYIRENL